MVICDNLGQKYNFKLVPTVSLSRRGMYLYLIYLSTVKTTWPESMSILKIGVSRIKK